METRSNGERRKNFGIQNVPISYLAVRLRCTRPGLLESVYEACLVFELEKVGCKVERQKSLPVRYKGLELDEGFRLDLLVNDAVVVELKCVEKLLPIHEAQLYTYLKLSGKRTGLLINFLSKLLKDGIQRIVC